MITEKNATYTEDHIDCEDLVFAIETGEDDVKNVHFYGYGYGAGDDSSPAPYRFVEYTFFYVPLTEVLERGVFEVESEDSECVKQYITDCTYEEMLDVYRHYDNGNCPKPITIEDMSDDLADGTYVIQYVRRP